MRSSWWLLSLCGVLWACHATEPTTYDARAKDDQQADRGDAATPTAPVDARVPADGAVSIDGALPSDAAVHAADGPSTGWRSDASATQSRIYALQRSSNPEFGITLTSWSVEAADGGLTAGPSLPFEGTLNQAALSVDGARVYAHLAGVLVVARRDAMTGSWSELDRVTYDGGPSSPLLVHPSGRWLLAGGELFPLKQDGSFQGPSRPVPADTGLVRWVWSPDTKFLFALSCASHAVTQYGFDETAGTLSENIPEATDSESNDLTFHPSGRWAYVANRGDVVRLGYASESGRFETAERVRYAMPSLPELACTNKRLLVHPSGRFAYLLTNAEVFTFAVAADGKLGSPARFEHYLFRAPNSFAIDRTGRFMFVGNGAANMQVFSLDTETGAPTFLADAPESTTGIYDIVAVVAD